jgi:NhaP-type Na+/H+ or K+/H+ antiporter
MALAALAGKNWFSAVGWDAWEQSLIGFFGSIALGFVLGYG